MFSVLTGTGIIIGILGFLWFAFFAPKPVRKQAKTSTPEVPPSPTDESGELKSQLAFQDQQRALETPTPLPKERPKQTPTSTPKAIPKTQRIVRNPDPPRRVQNFNPPPPRVVRTVSPPPPVTMRSPQPIASRPRPTEKIDPYERWAQLAALGQSRGPVADEPNNTQTAIATNSLPTPTTSIPVTATSIPTQPVTPTLSTQNPLKRS